LQEMDKLASDLEAVYDVKRFTFGQKVTALGQEQTFSNSIRYDEKLTNISDLFRSFSSLYSNRNIGALVLATDGIFNAGFNPVYQATRSGFPIYTLALGDTAQRKDIILSHVSYNRVVYLDSKFPLQITVQAHDCEGLTTTLSVSENGQTLFTKKITPDQKDFTTTVNVILDARETGLKKYRVRLSGVEGELSLQNNVQDIYVEVLDARNKILILYHSPHPDVAALKEAAEINENYEVEESQVDEFTGHLEAYNMIVLHQVPAIGAPSNRILDEIQKKQIPVLSIIGTQSDLVRLNQWEQGLKIVSNRMLFEEALPAYNSNFGLFTLDDDTRRLLNSFPPLTVPSGDYQQSTMSVPLAFQRIGTVQTTRPLILLNQNLQYRSVVITGEGIWRWRMMNYSISGNQDVFNNLFNKIFQYLSLKEQKKNLRIYHKSSFPEYDRVTFDAEVYNRNYELVNDPELEMVITDENGKQFPFTFSKSLNAYKLDAGKFAPGNYSYQARVILGQDNFTATGQFSVNRVDLESLVLVANQGMLHTLVAESNGKVYLPGQMSEMESSIRDNEDIKPLIYTSKRITELIDLPWLLALVIGLLTLEWFVRKRSGSY